MFDCIVKVDNSLIRIILPHKCGSTTFGDLIKNDYFDVEIIAINDPHTKCDNIYVYGRTPYKKTISSFFQQKYISSGIAKSQEEYLKIPLENKIDEFRKFISEIKQAWDKYGLMYDEKLMPHLRDYYSHIQPTTIDVFNAVWDMDLPFDKFKIGEYVDSLSDKITFLKLEDVRNNFPLKDNWKRSDDRFALFKDFEDYLNKYELMRQETHDERYEHHVYYNSTNILRNAPYYVFYDKPTLDIVNELFEMDFRFFDYEKCDNLTDIKEYTYE